MGRSGKANGGRPLERSEQQISTPTTTSSGPGRQRLGLWCAMAVAVLLGLYVLAVFNARPHVSGERVRLDTFAMLVAEGRVRDARILDQDSFVVGRYIRDNGTTGRYNLPYLQDASRERLVDLLLDARVPLEITQQFSKRLLVPATMLLPALIAVVVFFYLIASHRSGTGLFGLKSGARRAEAGMADSVTFDDVAGQEAAITELAEVRDFLVEPDRFKAVGAVVPKGILLFGPPGCGKTLLARAVAGEAGAAFYSISGSDFVELYVGVGAARVRELFREARQNAPAILFIDELDSVGRRRAGDAQAGGSSGEQEQALNQILAEMDGFSPLQGIIVMAATNRPDILDPALLRPGRFDRLIGLERPDEQARSAILAVHAANKTLDPDVDLGVLAARSMGLSGADLAAVMNEGALRAVRAGRSSISRAELDSALDRVIAAPDLRRKLSQRDHGFSRSALDGRPVTFGEVAGLDEAVKELAEIRDHLLDPRPAERMGARPPNGILLLGPPGSGKTLLARAVATEARAAFFAVAGTEFHQMYAGEGPARVRDLFAEARASAPAVVFIDEIDAVGGRRETGSDSQGSGAQILNQILIELDGFDARSGVVVLAASNRPELLDPALTRPGRFDRTLLLGLPDRASRLAILAVHAAGKQLAPAVDLEALAAQTSGFSGADLAGLLNEAALLAVRRGRSEVTSSEVDEAVERIGFGIGPAQVLGLEERVMVAHHEAGHAIVGMVLPGAHSPRTVSIVGRGAVLGITRHSEGVERLVHSRSVLMDRMAGLLGGRAAEEIVFGEPGSGSADDLSQASTLARTMVCDLGMSELIGPVAIGRDGQSGGQLSEETAAIVDREVRRLVAEAYERARGVLGSRKPALVAVAQGLMERETLGGDDVARLCGPLEPQD